MKDINSNRKNCAAEENIPEHSGSTPGQSGTRADELARYIGAVEESETKKDKDRRVRKTKKAIHEALLSLLEEKSFSEITIIELTERADVNRKTFYNHYESIHAVLDELEEDFANEMMEQIRQKALVMDSNRQMTVDDVHKFILANSQPHFSAVIGSIQDNKVFLKLINDPEIERGFVSLLVEQDLELFKEIMGNNSSKAIRYVEDFLRYSVTGSLAVIKDWAKNGYRTSPDELAEFFSMLFSGESVFEYIRGME